MFINISFQSFHKYLVEQLLSMHTDVLASVVSLRKTVKELSAKTDKTVSFPSWTLTLDAQGLSFIDFFHNIPEWGPDLYLPLTPDVSKFQNEIFLSEFQLEHRHKGVDSYLSVAEQMQKSESEFSLDFYTKMGLRNSQIEESAKSDELATQEYVKVTIELVFTLKTNLEI